MRCSENPEHILNFYPYRRDPLLRRSRSPGELQKRRNNMLTKEKKQEIIKEYATKEGDTGSPEVQVAILTYRINDLNEHLKEHH